MQNHPPLRKMLLEIDLCQAHIKSAFPAFSESLKGVVKRTFSRPSPLGPLFYLNPSLFVKIFVALYNELIVSLRYRHGAIT